ncbi:hypothetical protein C8J57DRAFT_1473762 [Mycena rebaudengoi]|nr:hypothetical protein C8J57DRAFT_1473762 [Mycena rebaudengoi]
MAKRKTWKAERALFELQAQQAVSREATVQTTSTSLKRTIGMMQAAVSADFTPAGKRQKRELRPAAPREDNAPRIPTSSLGPSTSSIAGRRRSMGVLLDPQELRYIDSELTEPQRLAIKALDRDPEVLCPLCAKVIPLSGAHATQFLPVLYAALYPAHMPTTDDIDAKPHSPSTTHPWGNTLDNMYATQSET